METLRRLVVALSGNDQLALLQSAYIRRFRGPLPMLNARCGIRGRGLMSASSSRTAATATAMQMRQIPRDHHIMNPLCAANTGRRVSLSFLSSFSLDRFHRLHLAGRIALSSAAVPHRFYYSGIHTLSLPCRAERGQAALNEMSQVSYRLPS